jgi:F-type H+-transporting ATPase subunit b
VLTTVIHLPGLAPMAVGTEAGTETRDAGPGPIEPELKELYWTAGSFIVLALAMRLFLFPRLKKSMDARYNGIRTDHEQADATRAAARAEVADYEAPREQLESERQEQIAALNARLAERRAAAQAESDAAKLAVRDQIHAAVADVAGRAGELATGRRPEASVLDRVVGEVMAR